MGLPDGSTASEHPLPFGTSGVLPMGRWTVTEAEAEAYCATADDVHRRALWTEWQLLTGALREAVGVVPFCWLGGSFFTSKEEPGDIDCVYFIEPVNLVTAKANKQAAQLIQAASGGGNVKSTFGLRIDSYIVNWTPTRAMSADDVSAERYFKVRGFWDDLWCRHRASDPRLDALPRRGYLEVVLDGIR